MKKEEMKKDGKGHEKHMKEHMKHLKGHMKHLESHAQYLDKHAQSLAHYQHDGIPDKAKKPKLGKKENY